MRATVARTQQGRTPVTIARIGDAMRSEILGVVLAGGASRRMGTDKSELGLSDGEALAERALRLLRETLGEAVLSLAEAEPGRSGRQVVIDRHPGCGPLAGLEAGLAAAGGRPIFALACDLPRVDARVVERIVARAEPGTATPAAWLATAAGRIQPLCGIYSDAVISPLQQQLAARRFAVQELVARIEVVRVPVDDLGSELLLNLNRPRDLARAMELSDEP